MVLIMAKEITVTFENGGIFEGFANTYTLNNEVTYYFSFDRDYRVQLTDNNITLQEYRNASAWYPIDIITNFAVSEISATGGDDVTKDWVNQNFVKKAGDTMTGALNFDFGNGRMVSIGQSETKNRGLIILNGDMQIRNQEDNVVATIATSTHATINLYKGSNDNNSNIYFRNYTFGGTGLTRSISYTQFRNNDTNTTWEFNGKYQANDTWQFKYGGVYFDTWAYWRSNDSINTIIQNNGGIRIYNGNNLAIHEFTENAETNYYSAYKYNGRDTVSNVGGQDPRYRIIGYNDFVYSTEFYSRVAIKQENQTTGVITLLTRGNIYIEDVANPNNNDKTQISQTQFRQYIGSKSRFSIIKGRIDCFNDQRLYLHSGDSGTTESYTEFKHNGISRANYKIGTGEFNINGGTGPVYLSSSASGTALRLDAKNGDYSLTSSYGTVTGAGLYTTCNNTYYSESFLNALNACLGYIFDNIGHKYWVQFKGESYATGGGSSRGGGVGRK